MDPVGTQRPTENCPHCGSPQVEQVFQGAARQGGPHWAIVGHSCIAALRERIEKLEQLIMVVW